MWFVVMAQAIGFIPGPVGHSITAPNKWIWTTNCWVQGAMLQSYSLQSNRQLRCCSEANRALVTANVLQMHEENARLLIALTLFCFTVTTGTLDKRSVKYNTSTSGFTTASVITGLNQPVWQSLSFPLFSVFPNHFPQFQVTQNRPTFCEKSRTAPDLSAFISSLCIFLLTNTCILYSFNPFIYKYFAPWLTNILT